MYSIIQSSATDPQHPSVGDVYCESMDGHLYCFDGDKWNLIPPGKNESDIVDEKINDILK